MADAILNTFMVWAGDEADNLCVAADLATADTGFALAIHLDQRLVADDNGCGPHRANFSAGWCGGAGNTDANKFSNRHRNLCIPSSPSCVYAWEDPVTHATSQTMQSMSASRRPNAVPLIVWSTILIQLTPCKAVAGHSDRTMASVSSPLHTFPTTVS